MDLCLVAGCGDISSNVLCRMVHHAGSQGFSRCSLSSLFFYFTAPHQLFQVGTTDRDMRSGILCLCTFLSMALPTFNYMAAWLRSRQQITWGQQWPFISICRMRNSRDKKDPHKELQRNQTVLAFSFGEKGDSAESTESLMYDCISVIVLLQGLSKFLQRALPECLP